MSRKYENLPIKEVDWPKLREELFERLVKLHNPDDELLDRMWEMDPATMSRLMPEIGKETAEEIEAETPKLRSYINFALNSLRISLGREPRWTPRQRMREARWQFENGVDSTNS